jgi:hypothetical protein
MLFAIIINKVQSHSWKEVGTGLRQLF